MRPLPIDILHTLLPLALGCVLFFAASRLARRSKAVQGIGAVLAISLIGLAIAAKRGLLNDAIDSSISYVGGANVILCWGVLLLLGIAWAAPERRISGAFLASLAVIASVMILIESGGRLYWRFFESEYWQRIPDADGKLRQSTGVTCSPVAGAMLLHHYGIDASEGEMAYLANTSRWGTDAFGLAAALNHKVQDRGWHAQARHVDYDACVRSGEPFVAHIDRPGVGGHAILVLRATAETVDLIDPLDGLQKRQSQTDFKKEWDGTVIWIDGNQK